ncbi:MAG: hypothetical protein K0Q91_1213 [Fibrobacteria bacterium]|jgi:hypothetical protein|nr:hypothetical protein [Fibrobacteria bacterium]
MAPPARKLPKAALWALAILAALGALLVCALALGGWWLEHRTLRQEIRFGENRENSIRVHGAEISWWTLRVRADSVWYRSPVLDARLGKLSADADLLAGLMTFMPAAAVSADSAYLRVRPDTAPKEKKPLDSLAFPDFKIPVALKVKLRSLVVEDDSGILVRADTLSVRNRGAQEAEAQVRAVRSRWTGGLAFAAKAGVDWSLRDSVAVNAEARRGPDRATLRARQAKRPLWHGRQALEAAVAETRPYARALVKNRAAADSLPNARNVRLKVASRLSKKSALDLSLRGEVAAYALSEDFTLSPQSLSLNADWKDGRGRLDLKSRGRAGEDVALKADARVLPGFHKLVREREADSLSLWTRLEYTAFSVRGHARNFRVMVQDTLRRADLVIEKADWNGSRLAVNLLTGDGSRLEASGRKNPAGPWNASFVLNAKPEERWVRIFTGDDVSFAALDAEGEARGDSRSKQAPTVRATLAARRLTAYGFKLDSIRSSHRYGPDGYVLEPSRLYDKKTAWTLAGTVRPSPRGEGVALAFELSAPDRGSLRYALDPDGTMEARATLFDAGALPYAYLDSLPLENPVLDGVFIWNPARKTGRADLVAQARFKALSGKKEDVEARVRGSWDARLLDLEQAGVKMKGSELNVGARLRLNGRQFWQAWEVKPAQYENASVRTPGFDIAAVLALFQPEPVLSKGSVNGELSYGDKSGFEGKLTFASITPRDAIGDVVLKELELQGNGDTLFVVARTTSESVKPLNARLRLALSALLREEQHLRADLVAGDSLRVRLDASTRRFQSLKGTLDAEGSAALPEKSGALERLRIGMDFDVPVVDPVNRATMTTRAFEGVYVLPGLARQTFSLDPVLRGGVFRVPRFAVKNEQGQSVAGSLEYNLAKGSVKAHVEGERFAAQWADDYKADLRDLNFDFSRDALGMRVEGSFSSASFLYVDAPVYARGTLTSVRFAYDEAKGPAAGGSARQRRERSSATLTLSGNLSESLLRYRMKTFADLQKVFRKERKKRRSGPALRLNVKVQTLGNNNYIDSDILRLTWVGNLSVRGVHPYTLFNGRINALNGGLGLDKQAYDVQRFEVKWLNDPMEEGRVNMEARKVLAGNCRQRNDPEVDSCIVITRLEGELSEMQFSYDSDCGGSFGAGASVAAILYSVQRGCYDASLTTGEGGNYGGKALSLLEPTINRSLSGVIGRYSRNWIEAAEVSGLGSLSSEEDPAGDTLGEALALGLTSKEYLRTRLKIQAGYHTASEDLSNPWEYMGALEWRPYVEYVRSPAWKRRLDQNLRLVASLQTRASRIDQEEEDEIEKKIGLNYTYFFWGNWWSKPRKREDVAQPPMVKPAQTTGEPK